MMSEQNVKQAKSDSEVQNNKKCFIIMPISTPDGYFYTQKKGRCTANDRKTEEICRILRSVR